MRVKIRINLISGIVFLILSIAMLLLIPTQIDLENTVKVAVDARFFPQLITYVVMALSSLLIIQSIFFKNDKVIELEIKEEVRTIGFWLICLFYVLLLPLIGFLISSLIATTAMLIYFRTRKKLYFVITYGIVAFSYILFSVLLNVILPTLIFLGV